MSSSSLPKDTEKKQSPCAECGRDTWHRVHGTLRRGDREPDGYYWEETSYFLECAGCGSSSVQKVFSDASMNDEDADVKVFPPRMPRKRPAWLWQINLQFQTLLKEIYEALGTGALALPVMGARTILDLVIRDRVGDQGDFKKGLDALESKGLLSRHDREILEAAIAAGSAAAHRGFEPEKNDVDAVIEIVEHLLNSQYVLPSAAKRIKSKTPSRPPRPPET